VNDTPDQPLRGATTAFVILVVAIVGAGALLLLSRPQPVTIQVNPPLPTATPEPAPTPGPVTAYVTGAVAQPGLVVELPAGSRVEQALALAGGPLPDADLERVNLAQVVRDGDQIHVPRQDEAALLPTPGGGGLVRINHASLEELTALPGIGPALAGRIVAYREANGPFEDLDALDQVSGIGPALLAQITGLIVFD
jgi:competence protein ComEA